MTGIRIPIEAEDRGARKQLVELNRSLAEMARQANIVTGSFRNLNNAASIGNSSKIKEVTRDVKNFGDQSKKSLKDTKTESDKLATSINGLVSGFKALITVSVATVTTTSFLRAGDTVIRYRNALSLTSDTMAGLLIKEQELRDIARETRSSIEDSITTYKTLALTLSTLGVSDRKIVKVTSNLQKMAAMSSGSAESIKSAFVQLNQGLGSELRGQELRAVLEQFDYLGRGLRQELNMTAGELLKFAEAGNLTGKAMVDILLDMSETVDSDFAKSTATASQGMIRLLDASKAFFGELALLSGASRRNFSFLTYLADSLEMARRRVISATFDLTAGFRAFRQELTMFKTAILVVRGVLADKIDISTVFSAARTIQKQKDALKSFTKVLNFFKSETTKAVEEDLGVDMFGNSLKEIAPTFRDIAKARREATKPIKAVPLAFLGTSDFAKNARALFVDLPKEIIRSFIITGKIISRFFPTFFKPILSVFSEAELLVVTKLINIRRKITDEMFKLSNNLKLITFFVNPFANSKNVEKAFTDMFRADNLIEFVEAFKTLNNQREQGRRWLGNWTEFGQVLNAVHDAGEALRGIGIRLGLIENVFFRIGRLPKEELVEFFRLIASSLQSIYKQNIAPELERILGFARAYLKAYGSGLRRGILLVFRDVGRIIATLVTGSLKSAISLSKKIYETSFQDMSDSLLLFIIKTFSKLGKETFKFARDIALSFYKGFKNQFNKNLGFETGLEQSYRNVSTIINDIISSKTLGNLGGDVIEFSNNLKVALSNVENFTKRVKGYFLDAYDKVVGNSYWPDLIDGVVAKTSDLDRATQILSGFTRSTKGLFQTAFSSASASLNEVSSAIQAMLSSFSKIDFSILAGNIAANLFASITAAIAIFSGNTIGRLIGLSHFFAMLGEDAVDGLAKAFRIPDKSLNEMARVFGADLIDGVRMAMKLFADSAGSLFSGALTGIIGQTNIPLLTPLINSIFNTQIVGKLLAVFTAYQLLLGGGFNGLTKTLKKNWLKIYTVMNAGVAGMASRLIGYSLVFQTGLDQVLGTSATALILALHSLFSTVGGDVVKRIALNMVSTVGGALTAGFGKVFSKLKPNKAMVGGVIGLISSVLSNASKNRDAFVKGDIGIWQALTHAMVETNDGSGRKKFKNVINVTEMLNLDIKNGEGKGRVARFFVDLGSLFVTGFSNFKNNIGKLFRSNSGINLSNLFTAGLDGKRNTKPLENIFNANIVRSARELSDGVRTTFTNGLVFFRSFKTGLFDTFRSIAEFSKSVWRSVVRDFNGFITVLLKAKWLIAAGFIFAAATASAASFSDATKTLSESFLTLIASVTFFIVTTKILVSTVLTLIDYWQTFFTVLEFTGSKKLAFASAGKELRNTLTTGLLPALRKVIFAGKAVGITFASIVGGGVMLGLKLPLLFATRLVESLGEVALMGEVAKDGLTSLQMRGANLMMDAAGVRNSLSVLDPALPARRLGFTKLFENHPKQLAVVRASYKALGKTGLGVMGTLSAAWDLLRNSVILTAQSLKGLKTLLFSAISWIADLTLGLAVVIGVAAVGGAIGVWLFGPGDTLFDKFSLAWDWVRKIFGFEPQTRAGQRNKIEKGLPKLSESEIKRLGIRYDPKAVTEGNDYKALSARQRLTVERQTSALGDLIKQAIEDEADGKFTEEARQQLQSDYDKWERIMTTIPKRSRDTIKDIIDNMISSFEDSMDTSFFARLRNFSRSTEEGQLEQMQRLAREFTGSTNVVQERLFDDILNLSNSYQEFQRRVGTGEFNSPEAIAAVENQFKKQTQRLNERTRKAFEEQFTIDTGGFLGFNATTDVDKQVLGPYLDRLKALRDEYGDILNDPEDLLPQGFQEAYKRGLIQLQDEMDEASALLLTASYRDFKISDRMKTFLGEYIENVYDSTDELYDQLRSIASDASNKAEINDIIISDTLKPQSLASFPLTLFKDPNIPKKDLFEISKLAALMRESERDNLAAVKGILQAGDDAPGFIKDLAGIQNRQLAARRIASGLLQNAVERNAKDEISVLESIIESLNNSLAKNSRLINIREQKPTTSIVQGRINESTSAIDARINELVDFGEATSVFMKKLQSVQSVLYNEATKGLRIGLNETLVEVNKELDVDFGGIQNFYLSEVERQMLASMSYFNKSMKDRLNTAIATGLREDIGIDVLKSLQNINRRMERNRARAAQLNEENKASSFMKEALDFLGGASNVFDAKALSNAFEGNNGLPFALSESLKTLKRLNVELDKVAADGSTYAADQFLKIKGAIDDLTKSLTGFIQVDFSLEAIKSRLQKAGAGDISVPMFLSLTPDSLNILAQDARTLNILETQLGELFSSVNAKNIEAQREVLESYNKELSRVKTNLSLIKLSTVTSASNPQAAANSYEDNFGQTINSSIRADNALLQEYIGITNEIEKLNIALADRTRVRTSEELEGMYKRLEALDAYKASIKEIKLSEALDALDLGSSSNKANFIRTGGLQEAQGLVGVMRQLADLSKFANESQLLMIAEFTNSYEQSLERIVASGKTLKERLENIGSDLGIDGGIKAMLRFSDITLDVLARAREKVKALYRVGSKTTLETAERILELTVKQSELEKISTTVTRSISEGFSVGYNRVSSSLSRETFLNLNSADRGFINDISASIEGYERFLDIASEADIAAMRRAVNPANEFGEGPGSFKAFIESYKAINANLIDNLNGPPETLMSNTNELISDGNDILKSIRDNLPGFGFDMELSGKELVVPFRDALNSAIQVASQMMGADQSFITSEVEKFIRRFLPESEKETDANPPIVAELKDINGVLQTGFKALVGRADNVTFPEPVTRAATGGYISGPGGPVDDRVPAMLSNGEFVVNAKATKRFRPILDRLNSGIVPGFKTGTIPAFSDISSRGLRAQANVGDVSTKILFLFQALNEEFGRAGIVIPRVTEEMIAMSSPEVKTALLNMVGALDGYKEMLTIGGESAERAKLSILRLKDSIEDLTESSFRYAQDILQAGKSFVSAFESSINDGLKSLFKGNSSFKDFGINLLDAFTGSVVDTFVNGITTRMFSAENKMVENLQSLGSGIFDGIFKIFTRDKLPVGTTTGPLSSPAAPQVGLFAGLLGQPAGAAPMQSGALGSDSGEVAADISTIASASTRQIDILGGLGNIFMTGLGGLGNMFMTGLRGLGGLFKGILGMFNGGGGGVGILGIVMQGFRAFSGGGFATGGFVSGAGTGISDSIPTMLSNGEYVINAKTTATMRPLLDAINFGRIDKFATGGLVGNSVNTNRLGNFEVDRSKSTQVINLSITGDISSQTKKEIYRMLPEIASGVNQHNREIGR